MATLALALLAGGGVLFLAAPAAARGPLARYAGLHPLNPHMGAFCYIDVPHVHAEWPPDIRVYRTLSNKTQAFIGDPVALGYDGPKYAYFGPHPLVFRDLPATEGAYCYLRGPHHHAQPPQPATSFVSKDGVYWFMGSFPPEFARDYAHNDWINEVRGMGTYHPPKVAIADAPPGYRLPAVFDTPAVVPIVAGPGDGTSGIGKKSRKAKIDADAHSGKADGKASAKAPPKAPKKPRAGAAAAPGEATR